jgi:hypothetical protein
MDSLGRWLVVAGLVLVVAGLAVMALAHLGIPLGRLPGDIRIERDGFRFYFPLGTCVALSVVLSLVLWLIGRLR